MMLQNIVIYLCVLFILPVQSRPRLFFPRLGQHRPAAPDASSSPPKLALNGSATMGLTYMETMAAGAISRTFAQTIMHPANTYKTLLQLRNKSMRRIKLTPERLLRGADAQFLMSLPHGAFYFFIVELAKSNLESLLPKRLQFFADFASSTFSTIVCSIISTPQMVLTDRLMAGVYPSFSFALRKIMRTEGLLGFYTGWWPALAQKIPSYGLTWMFFQQLKRSYEDYRGLKPSGQASFILGAIASAASVCVMIPMDTVKTRLVIQQGNAPLAYKGVGDCFRRIIKEEGVGSLYSSLTPRLLSVVPMIAIQYGIYELMRAEFIRTRQRSLPLIIKTIKSKSLKATGAALKVPARVATTSSSFRR